MEAGIIVHEPAESSQSMTVQSIHNQIQLIQQVMKTEMKEGEHYGTVPGCGDKKVLLKPGAEKLCLLFKMAPRFKIENVDMGNGHREVRITTELYHIESGKFLGEGVGSCSTMESKYRYRGTQVEPTGEVVPKEYWKTRDPELLGGKQFVAKKIENQWLICLKGEKTENPDIADTYNTVLKIGKKRSQVDAALTVTAASDLFTQDLEENVSDDAMRAPVAERAPEPQRKAVSTFVPDSSMSDEEYSAGRGYTEPPYSEDTPEEVDTGGAFPQGRTTPPAARPAPKSVPRGTVPPKGPIGDRKVMVSQFSGSTCTACGKKIEKGQTIVKEPGSTAWTHETHGK